MDIDSQIDVIFQRFEGLFSSNRFDDANRIFLEYEPEKLELEIIHAILSITLCAKDRLPGRRSFLENATRVIYKREPTRARLLLEGLE